MKIYPVLPRGFAANAYLVTENGADAVAVDPAQPRVLQEAEKLGLAVRYVLLTHGHFDHIGGCAALQKRGAKVGCLAAERDLALHANLGLEMGGAPVPAFSMDFTFGDGDVLDLCGMRFEVVATPGHTAGSCCFLLSLPAAIAAGERGREEAKAERGPLLSPFKGESAAGERGREEAKAEQGPLLSPSKGESAAGERGREEAKAERGPLLSPFKGESAAGERGCLYSLFTGDTLFRGDIGRCDLPTGDISAMRASLEKLKNLKSCTVYPGHGPVTTLQHEKEYGYLRT